MTVTTRRLAIGVALAAEAAPSMPLLFAGRLEEGIRCAADLGFDGVELSVRDPAQLDVEAIGSALEKLGLVATAIATGLSCVLDGACLAAPRAERRRGAAQRLRACVGLASTLGAPVIIGGIRGRLPADAEARASVRLDAMRLLRSCVAYAADAGVRVLLEPINRYETDFVNTVEDALAIIDEVDDRNLRLLIDTFHMNIEEASLMAAVRAAAPALDYVHVADSNRLAPGSGHLPFDSVLEALDAVGYEGPLVAEVLPRPDDLGAARACAAFLRRAVAAPHRHATESTGGT